MDHKTLKFLYRIFSKTSVNVKDSHNDGCWNWLGAKNRSGYGTILSGGRCSLVHRRLYEIFLGKQLNRKELACHRCDNPGCINPNHIFIGTVKDNVVDMVKKGRNGFNSRLSRADVIKIRGLTGKPGHSNTEVAKMYRVSYSTIYNIKKGTAWKNI